MDSEVDCFAGFCHYCLTTTTVHTHASHYVLFKSGAKSALWIIVLYRKDIELVHKYYKH